MGTIEDKLKDDMVSCYDNGDAMMEYADEYYLDLVLTDLGKLKWLSNDEGWNLAVDTIRKELPSIFGYVKGSE